MDIPWEAVVQPEDPRLEQAPAGDGAPAFRLALPPFALLPVKPAKPAESRTYSWSDAPVLDTVDDALSAGTHAAIHKVLPSYIVCRQ